MNIKHSGREDNERERERYRLEREREDRGMERGGGGAGGGRPDFRDRGDRGSAVGGNMFGGDRRRSRSPRIDRRERDRSRHRSRSPRADRKKRRSSRDRNDDDGASSAGDGERGSSSRRERRDRSERAGDKEKSKRSKRSRSRERGSKRDKRDKERGLGERKEKKPDFREGDIKIKEEPVDGECCDKSNQINRYARTVPVEQCPHLANSHGSQRRKDVAAGHIRDTHWAHRILGRSLSRVHQFWRGVNRAVSLLKTCLYGSM